MAQEVIGRTNALPASRVRVLAVGAAALGAVAIGAFAIGRLAVGLLTIKKARFGVTVRRLRIVEREGLNP